MGRLKVDICVIGAGSGGLTVAAGAAQMGARVALIERAEMGGDCLNNGCIPSKSLLAVAKAAAAPARMEQFGLTPQMAPAVDRARVRQYVDGVIAAIAPNDSVARFEGMGVTVLRASARFLGSGQVEAGDCIVDARWVVVASGAGPMVPPFPGLDQVDYFTTETIFANEAELPHLIIVGGGPIGLEMAQANRRLGSAVTVIEMARILPRDDGEAVAVLRRCLTREGIELREGARVTAVHKGRDGRGVSVEIEDESGGNQVTGSHLLLAVGRRAATEGLNLEAAGIEYGAAGITVDARLRTSNKRVYAIGDVTGGPQFTHAAGHQAAIVIRNILFRLPAKSRPELVPWVTYTDPELAHVGLGEAEAGGQAVNILRWPFADNDRARTEGQIDGFIKIVATAKGRVLGATIVGAHAGELIAPWVLAVKQGMKLSTLAGLIIPYPTLSEVSQRVAGSYYTPKLFNDRMRRLVRFLMWFG